MKIYINNHSAFCHACILLIISCFFCSCRNRVETLSFKDCQASYYHHNGGKEELYPGHFITDEMELEAAQRRLAACLCEEYIKIQDISIRSKIIELYNEEETYFRPSAEITTNDIDSIIRYRKELFDTIIVIE